MNNTEFLEKLKKSDTYLYIACTGAGAGIQNIIWLEPGISNVFVGSCFPYNKHDTDSFLGFTPDKYVSEETAMNMAIESFIRAKVAAYKDEKWNQKCIGLGLSASVASEKVHRGDHCIFCCTVSDDGVTWTKKSLWKGAGREVRKEDGCEADFLAQNAILTNITGKSIPHNENAWGVNLLKSCFWTRPVFTYNERREEGNNKIKFPGNFNPPHAGHFDMALRSSEKMSGKSVDYLINIDNPHKPHVSLIECLCRVAMFRASKEFKNSCNCIEFTMGQPLFVDKVGKYPTCKFIVGVDTLQRMLDPKWGPSTEEVLKRIPKWSLILFNRKENDNTTTTLDDIILKEEKLQLSLKLCDIIGSSLPISSSQIREQRNIAKIQKEDLWPVP